MAESEQNVCNTLEVFVVACRAQCYVGNSFGLDCRIRLEQIILIKYFNVKIFVHNGVARRVHLVFAFWER